MQFKWMFEELVLLYQTTKSVNKDEDIKAHITRTPQGNCKNNYEINKLYYDYKDIQDMFLKS